jgi:deoxyribonuclease V
MMKVDHLKLHQLNLATKIRITRIDSQITRIAGVDVAAAGDMLVGCITVLKYPSLDLIEYTWDRARARIGYVPGYLSFREIPVLLKCYRKLREKPDLLLVDGQGIAHPRALGLASHLGLLLRKPTIGCAKSHLYGAFDPPAAFRGAHTPILSKNDKKIGWVLRTRKAINPLFVSPGHLVDLEDCKKYVLASTKGFRIPEPIRYAHRIAGEKARSINV